MTTFRTVSGLLAGALLFVGLALGCGAVGGEREPLFLNPSPEPRRFGDHGPETRYVVLGDSTAAGRGGDYEKGIAISTARELAHGRRVVLVNLAVSGARIGDVRQNQLAEACRLHANLVLLVAGSNDVTHLTPIRSMRQDLRAIAATLREGNPRIAIVVTGSADIGSPPRVPFLLRPIASIRTKRVNRMVRRLADAERLTFAPIAEETGPLFRRDRTLFSADAFHPNDRGYATWIPVLNRALARALPTSP